MSRMGKDLIEAMQEAVAHSEGKIELKTTYFSLNPVCENISIEEIKNTRKKLGVSQDMFALILGVSKKTVKSWETGRYTPAGAARRLITMLQKDPALPHKYGILVSQVEDA